MEEVILKLDYDHAFANTAMFTGDEETRAALGFGMVAEDYVAINGSGDFGDKAGAMRRYGRGGVKILFEKFADMRARVFGDAAIVTGTWCIKSVREGTAEAPPGAVVGKEMIGATRITRIWVKRNGKWQVVSWHGTGIPQAQNSSAQADNNPFVGTWKLNLANSKIIGPEGTRPLPLTNSVVIYQAVGDQLKVTDDDTFIDGHSIHME